MLRRMVRSKFFMLGLLLVLFLIVCIVMGPNYIPFKENGMDLRSSLISPQGFSQGVNGHVLGTDKMGRDLLIRLLIGGRTSFVIALLGVAGGGLLGTIMGMLAGFYGKKVDALIMRLGDVQLSINTTLLAIVIASILGASVQNLIIVMII